MDALAFIENEKLRKTLEESMWFISALGVDLKSDNRNALYREETCRVIILYVVSSIEAVLLYLYKRRGEKMVKSEYRHVHQLPNAYAYGRKTGARVVVAMQETIERKDYEIGLHDLVTFFKGRILLEKTAEKILSLNDVRNTFHLSKSREKRCDDAWVESALAVLVHVLENAPHAITTSRL